MKLRTMKMKIASVAMAVVLVASLPQTTVLAAKGDTDTTQETPVYSSTETVKAEEGDADYSPYDITVDFYATDGVLTKITVTSGWGLALTQNKTLYSDFAISTIVTKMKTGEITEADVVSHATCTSVAFLDAVLKAKAAGAYTSVSPDLTYTLADDSSALNQFISFDLVGYDAEFGGYQYKMNLSTTEETGAISLLVTTDLGGKLMYNPASPESSNAAAYFKYDAATGIYTVSTKLYRFEYIFDSVIYGAKVHDFTYQPSIKVGNKIAIANGSNIAYTKSDISYPDGDLLTAEDVSKVTFDYYSDAGLTTKLDGVPTEAGTYYVQAVATVDKNKFYTDTQKSYNAGTLTVVNGTQYASGIADSTEDDITPYNLTVSFAVNESKELTYIEVSSPNWGGDENNISAATDAMGQLSAALIAGTALDSSGAGTRTYDALKTTIEQAKADGIWESVSSALSCSVNKTTIIDSYFENNNNIARTYTGKAVSVSPIVTQGGVETNAYSSVVKYYSDAALTQELTGAPTEVGTYYVLAVVTTDDSEYGTVSGQIGTLTIAPAASTVTLSAKTAAYTGKAISIDTAKTTGSTGKVTYTYYSDSKCTKALSGAPTSAGTYYVKATVAADTHYASATSSAVKLTISPAASTVKISAKTAAYTGKAIAIGTAKTTGSKGKVTYKYYSDSKCTKALANAPKNAGTYYVKATVAADTNYASATSSAVKLTIKKASQTISKVTTSKTVTYTKVKTAAQTFKLGGTAKTTLSYQKTSGSSKISVSSTGKVTVKKGTAKGTYNIKVKVTAKATTNYSSKAATKTIVVKVK